EQAQVAMESYLKNHPQGHYISNAHYWLGELYLLKNQTQKALTQFQVVANRYPQSPKIPDALLKIGFVYYDIGQFVKAKQQLLQVTQKYPNTTVAQLANNRLRMIAQLNQNDVQKQNPNANTQNH
ncbi:MAG: tol-pal system protein YbgF, partial [Pseudomonadota bacterium]